MAIWVIAPEYWRLLTNLEALNEIHKAKRDKKNYDEARKKMCSNVWMTS